MTESEGSALAVPQTVLFDLDGTLIDSAPDIRAAVNELLAAHRLPPVTLTAVTAMIGNGIDKTVERAFAAVGSPIPAAELGAMHAEMAPIYTRHATGLTRLMPGAAEALADLQAAGIGIGLATNKPQQATREVLRHLGILKFFGAVVGADEVAEKKPAPDALWLALERLGADRGKAWMVGDSVTDVQAGRAAGLPVILVRGGYSTEPLESLGADRICDTLSALVELLFRVRHAG